MGLLDERTRGGKEYSIGERRDIHRRHLPAMVILKKGMQQACLATHGTSGELTRVARLRLTPYAA